MPPKKGLSADEKQTVMLTLMQTELTVYNKDELIKKGGRAGVVEKTVMDAIEILQAEKKVESDKIGSGVFFWSFLAKAVASHKADEEAALAAAARDEPAAAAAEARRSELEGSVSPADAARRAQKQAELEGAMQRAISLKAEVAAKAEFDPVLIDALEAKVKIAKAGADRWTANLLEMKSVRGLARARAGASKLARAHSRARRERRAPRECRAR
jgi:hypothetical protein